MASSVSEPSVVSLDNKQISSEKPPSTMDEDNQHYGVLPGDDRPEPTQEELLTLRKVSGKLPLATWLVAIVELAERFTYYGLSGVFMNYMTIPRGSARQVGGLGWSTQRGTGLSNFFQFWCYITPILGGTLADMKWGRYNTILICSIVYVIGNIILLLTSIPSALEGNATAGKAGFIVALIVIGLGTGGIKSNVAPLIADQYTDTKAYVKTLKSGERVIVDPQVTTQHIFMVFYWCINVGSLSAIATSELEKNVDFWAAYLLPVAFFFIAIVVIVLAKNKYVRHPPQGSPIPNAFRVVGQILKNAIHPKIKSEHHKRLAGFTYDISRPECRAANGLSLVPWDDMFVDQVRRALTACRVFLFYPIYWVVYSQMTNNLITQAGQTELHGLPNDIMQNLDPITLIIFIPIMDRFVYPLLRRFGIRMKPITRIALGFFFCAGSMAYAAGVQKMIYDAGPCYDAPLACAASYEGGVIPDGVTGPEGVIPNEVHVAVQTPAYFLIGLSEIFASITGLEYAYTKAPSTMKSLIMALFLFTNAFGAILSICISSTATDPKYLPMYYSLAIVSAIAGLLFWFIYSPLNATEDEMNNLDAEEAAAENRMIIAKKNGLTEDYENQLAVRKSIQSQREKIETDRQEAIADEDALVR